MPNVAALIPSDVPIAPAIAGAANGMAIATATPIRVFTPLLISISL
jgi:hypothetical protein